MQNMPLNGRDFTQLIAIAPGYGGYSINGGGTINGARNNGINWQLDGTDNNDFWYNIPAINQGGVSGVAGVVMPIDAIDEFSTQTQSNAEIRARRRRHGKRGSQVRHQSSARHRILLQPQ